MAMLVLQQEQASQQAAQQRRVAPGGYEDEPSSPQVTFPVVACLVLPRSCGPCQFARVDVIFALAAQSGLGERRLGL